MGTTDKRVDAYIAKAAPFARPILDHLRKLVHAACPGTEETMKWSFPHFVYANQILCSMAAFKNHCAFGFWKASIMKDPHQVMQKESKTAMGSWGQITQLSDLPPDKIVKEYIKQAAKLNEEGVKVNRFGDKKVKKDLEIPIYFLKAISKNKNAKQTFEAFSTSNKREYVGWIMEAKTDETRDKRLQTAVEWMAEGKIRNWKYLKK